MDPDGEEAENLEGCAHFVDLDIDPVSEDLVIGMLAGLEKSLWMLRSHLVPTDS